MMLPVMPQSFDFLCTFVQVHAAFHNITAMVGAGVLGLPSAMVRQQYHLTLVIPATYLRLAFSVKSQFRKTLAGSCLHYLSV